MSFEVDLTKAADQCVMCGMCLPHCPTYQVSQHEAESPRGRISLVKAFSEGQLNTSPSLEIHLQSCTGCMKCEQICPANVPYQKIIDSGRYLYRRKLNFSAQLYQKISLAVMTHQWGHRLLSLLSAAAKLTPTKNRFVRLLQFINKSDVIDSTTTNQHCVTILPGCTASLFDQQTLNSVIMLLSHLNIQAAIPDKLMCCGALAQHSGHPQQAQKQTSTISHYLKQHNVTEFISFASGCGRQLNEYVANDQHQHNDIISWLTSSSKINTAKFDALPQRVLVHNPCTLKDDEADNVIKLLSLIPNIQLLEFNDDIFCCGAGGMQLISPHESNRALNNSKINTINTLQPDLIVSSNIGCCLSLQLGLQDADLDINVIHPVTLLAQQIKH